MPRDAFPVSRSVFLRRVRVILLCRVVWKSFQDGSFSPTPPPHVRRGTFVIRWFVFMIFDSPSGASYVRSYNGD